MHHVVVIGAALVLTACSSGNPSLSSPSACDYEAAWAMRAAAEMARRDEAAKGGDEFRIEMAPIRQGERIPAIGAIAKAKCQLRAAGLAPST